jgi:hypothetical protein
MEIFYGAIVLKVVALKEYIFQKVYYEPSTKYVNYDRNLFEFNWAV